MTAETALTVLKQAKELIATEDAWCQGSYAKNTHGRSIGYYDDRAARYCAEGACLRVSSDRTALHKALKQLSRAATKIDPKHTSVSINDCVGFAATHRMFDIAISELSE